MTYTNQPFGARNLPTTFRCTNHPDREGVGICVSCRSVVCVECSTRVDRMNYCIRCLAEAQPDESAKREDPARDRMLGIPLLLLSVAASTGVFIVLGVILAAMRSAGGGGVR